MGGLEKPLLDHRQHGVLEPAFSEEIDGGRLSRHEAFHHIEVFRGTQLLGVVAEQDDRVARVLKGVAGDVIHVLHDADHADDRCGVDRHAIRLVVERNVTARDGGLEELAGLGHGQHGLPKLVVDVGFERVSEVQVIGHGGWKRANTDEVPRGLGHGCQRSRPGVEIDVSAIAVGGRGYRPARAAKAHDAGIPAGPHRRAGSYGGVVLAIDPTFGGDVGRCDQLQESIRRIGVQRVEARKILTPKIPDLFRLDALALVGGTALRQGQGGDLGDHAVSLTDAEQTVVGDAADLLGLEFPLGQNIAHDVFAP